MDNRFYVYLHTSQDGRYVYVGKGTSGRAWNFSGRSKRWNAAFSRARPDVTFVARELFESDAFELEMETIIKLRQEDIHVINVELDRRGSASHWTPEVKAKFLEKMKNRPHPRLGKKMSPELRERFFAKSHSPEAIAKAKKTRGSYSISEEHKKAISTKLLGVKRGEAFAKKVSEAKKGRSNGRQGMKLSEETKNKMSEAATGRIMSQESIDKRKATIAARGGFKNPRAKPFICIQTGEHFRSPREAALKMFDGVGEKVIQQVLVGKKKGYRGYQFERITS